MPFISLPTLKRKKKNNATNIISFFVVQACKYYTRYAQHSIESTLSYLFEKKAKFSFFLAFIHSAFFQLYK